MNPEEKLLRAIDGDLAEELGEELVYERPDERRQRLRLRHKAAIDGFLGKGDRASRVVIMPRYYAELTAWALNHLLIEQNWKVTRILGYLGPESVYTDVYTDFKVCENLVVNGQLFIERGDTHFVVTIDANLKWRGSIHVEGSVAHEKEMEEFMKGIEVIARKKNIYRGKKIQFGTRHQFLNIKDKSWASVVLAPAIKADIRANTTGFLHQKALWSSYGIPAKRGILLTGEPGTGKTIICQAIMVEAEGITCITTNAYAMNDDDYITELYDMAQDLSPCIVFIEDLDLIGLNRIEYNYRSGPALLALLSVLDGVEEKQGIVTVATTNNLEALDRAISQRPSRFDRVVKLSLPSLQERKELVGLLCQKIPLDEPARSYIANKTEHCTPAQLQEIIYSLVITNIADTCSSQMPKPEFSKDDIDRAISRINGRNGHPLGFSRTTKYEADNPELTDVMSPIQEGRSLM